jgi:uncharacterized protein YbcI
MSGTKTEDGQLSTAASISNRVVHLMSEFTGRGPTKAWTSIDDDLVSVVLRDTLTKGERSLLADGEGQLVLEVRTAFQKGMREQLIAGVEQLTGRTVLAFLSASHLDPDIAVETFVMEPRAQVAAAPSGG